MDLLCNPLKLLLIYNELNIYDSKTNICAIPRIAFSRFLHVFRLPLPIARNACLILYIKCMETGKQGTQTVN